jgi:hypothetical protein
MISIALSRMGIKPTGLKSGARATSIEPWRIRGGQGCFGMSLVPPSSKTRPRGYPRSSRAGLEVAGASIMNPGRLDADQAGRKSRSRGTMDIRRRRANRMAVIGTPSLVNTRASHKELQTATNSSKTGDFSLLTKIRHRSSAPFITERQTKSNSSET